MADFEREVDIYSSMIIVIEIDYYTADYHIYTWRVDLCQALLWRTR